MTAREFMITEEDRGVYRLQGNLTIYEVNKLREFLEECLRSGRDAHLSLARLEFIDISALQLLIAFKNSSKPHVSLRITDISPEVRGLLALSGLKTALLVERA